MPETRAYQTRAIKTVESSWRKGTRSVLLVAPTGSGKTFMGTKIVAGQRILKRTLWCAHRREIVHQAADALRAMYGRENIGLIMAGHATNPNAPIQVGSTDTLLARDVPRDIERMVFDEAHHYVADKYIELTEAAPKALTLGLTATPERKDGKPLGDVFEDLVVAATYSELISLGYLVPWVIYQPPEHCGHHLAQDILSAWLAWSGGGRTFIFTSRVEQAEREARRFRAAGIDADVVHGAQPIKLREAAMARFKAGTLRVLLSVNALGEGVDVPHADVVILARPFHSLVEYVQACGLGGRIAKNKRHAKLIDLCGASLTHGSPVKDRDYSLIGRAISWSGEREARPTPEREEWVQRVLGMNLVLAPDSHFDPPEPLPSSEFRPRPRAERVEKKLRQITMKHGSAVAETMRRVYGGYAE